MPRGKIKKLYNTSIIFLGLLFYCTMSEDKRVMVFLCRIDVLWLGKFVITEKLFQDLQTFNPSLDFGVILPYIKKWKRGESHEEWSRMWGRVETELPPDISKDRNDDKLVLSYLARNKDGKILANRWPKVLDTVDSMTLSSFDDSQIM